MKFPTYSSKWKIRGVHGCLSFVGRKQLGWLLNNVRSSLKSENQLKEMVLTIQNSVSDYYFPLMRDWQLMERKFSTFRFERRRRNTSRGSSQIINTSSGKLLFHLTFNQNVSGLFGLDGKHSHNSERLFQKFSDPFEF